MDSESKEERNYAPEFQSLRKKQRAGTEMVQLKTLASREIGRGGRVRSASSGEGISDLARARTRAAAGETSDFEDGDGFPPEET